MSSAVQNGTPKPPVSPKTPGEAVNGMKATSSDASTLTPTPSAGTHNSVVKKQEKNIIDEGGAGDGPTSGVCHTLPLSPPNTPVPQSATSSSITSAGGGGEGEVCQKMQALAL